MKGKIFIFSGEDVGQSLIPCLYQHAFIEIHNCPTFDQSVINRVGNLQANPTCYFHDPSLGLRATGKCYFQTAIHVSSQHESQEQKYPLFNYNGMDLMNHELQ